MKNKLNHFSMIEISFALLVIAIGVTTIFGLIPIGSLAHAQAVNQNQAADAAENALNRLSAEVQKNWETLIVDYGIASDHEAINDNYIDNDEDPGFLNTSSWTHLDSSNDIGTQKSGLYLYSTTTYGNLYRFIQVTTLSDGSLVTDFDGVVKVWQSTVADRDYDTGNVDTRQNVIMLNVEISWPASLKFSNRHKAYYKMEVFCNSCIAN